MPIREKVEEWRDIPGHPNYQASSKGRIRNKIKGNILIPKRSPSRGGVYWKVDLGGRKPGKENPHNKRTQNKYINHLVSLAFFGEKGEHNDHKDADTSNNAIDNLQPLSEKNNLAKRHGAFGRGEAWEPKDGNEDFNPENF